MGRPLWGNVRRMIFHVLSPVNGVHVIPSACGGKIGSGVASNVDEETGIVVVVVNEDVVKIVGDV